MATIALTTFRFIDGACLAQAQQRLLRAVTLESPALWAMTDLTEVRAATVSADLTLEQAEQAMIQHGVRMLFVVSSMPCVDGIVSFDMLRGERSIRLIQQRHVRRTDLCVADVMSHKSELDVLDLAALAHATVGDVVKVLQQLVTAHLLVAETATPQGPARIRGVISRAQAERQLGMSLPAMAVARSFAEIEQALV
jgi:hypothetical protein